MTPVTGTDTERAVTGGTDLPVGPALVLEHDGRLVRQTGGRLLEQLRHGGVVPLTHLDPVHEPAEPPRRPAARSRPPRSQPPLLTPVS